METTGQPSRVFETFYGNSDKAALALCHPKFKGRADRLDLITNKMIGFKTAIGDKNYTVCDISESGFSYAEKVPVKKTLSYKQVKVKVDQIASSNYGKSLKCICFFESQPERGGFEAKGTIKNHNLFLVLSSDEIRQTVTSYLQSLSIRRSHDPQGFFKKLDLILSKSNKIMEEGCNEATLGIVINTTFQNLIMEIGAPAEIFETLYQGYINKPVYVKYGVAVDDRKEAVSLMKFAKIKNAALLNREDSEKNLILQQRLALIKKLNINYSYKDFVLIVWKNCLKHYHIDAPIELPKIEKEKVAHSLKEELSHFDGHLEKMADPEFLDGDSKGLEHYLCDGLYWYLIEKDKKYFDREVIKKDIRKLIRESFEECLIK